jgi:hypothetical protein
MLDKEPSKEKHTERYVVKLNKISTETFILLSEAYAEDKNLHK